jgi:hypothetical protein
MTQDEIIEMASQVYGECVWHESTLLRLEAFVKLVEDKAIAELESQEPVAWRFKTGTWWNREVHWRYVLSLDGTEGLLGLEPLYTHPPQRTEPVGKLQEPTVERAWFTIDELNAWADKKLSENPDWVMPKDEPERNDPPPQRTWIGLTDEDKHKTWYEMQNIMGWYSFQEIANAIEAKLKERNI